MTVDLNNARRQDDPGIVRVVEWFDEDRTQPASYVVKLADGKYEAIAFDRHLEDELSLGRHPTCDAAVEIIYQWSGCYSGDPFKSRYRT
jgi:hypothetical protein